MNFTGANAKRHPVDCGKSIFTFAKDTAELRRIENERHDGQPLRSVFRLLRRKGRRGVGDVCEAPHECMRSPSVPKSTIKSDEGYYTDGFGWVPSHPERPGIVTNVLLQTLKNVIFAMKCLKVPRTHKILDPAPRPMTP